jgi:hypothetical protein
VVIDPVEVRIIIGINETYNQMRSQKNTRCDLNTKHRSETYQISSAVLGAASAESDMMSIGEEVNRNICNGDMNRSLTRLSSDGKRQI